MTDRDDVLDRDDVTDRGDVANRDHVADFDDGTAGREVIHPWEADRPSDPEVFAAAIVERFPDLGGVDLERLGSGWNFDAYRVGEWVFRFPRRAGIGASIDRFLPLGDIVSRALAPLALSVPRLELVDPPTTGFPYRFTRHRFIEGVSAGQAEVGRPTLARDLGRALNALHQMTPAQLVGVDLMIETDNPGGWLEEALEIADELPEILGGDLVWCLEWLRAVESAPATYSGPLRFLHNDMAPDHVLVDPSSGTLVGIIDFDDAAWGDPAHDFVVMRAAMGSGFVDDMLLGYETPRDPHFRERVDFMARVHVLDWVRDAHLQGTDIEKHRDWVRNAFS